MFFEFVVNRSGTSSSASKFKNVYSGANRVFLTSYAYHSTLLSNKIFLSLYLWLHPSFTRRLVLWPIINDPLAPSFFSSDATTIACVQGINTSLSYLIIKGCMLVGNWLDTIDIEHRWFVEGFQVEQRSGSRRATPINSWFTIFILSIELGMWRINCLFSPRPCIA